MLSHLYYFTALVQIGNGTALPMSVMGPALCMVMDTT